MPLFFSHCRSIAYVAMFMLMFTLPSHVANAAQAAQSQEEASRRMGKLFVETTPSDTNIRFVHLQYRYKPGIILKEGRYVVEISKPGYAPLLKEVNIVPGRDNVVFVDLDNPDGLGNAATLAEPEDKRIALEDTISGDAGNATVLASQDAPESDDTPSSMKYSNLFDQALGKKSRKKEPADAPTPKQSAPAPAPAPAPVKEPVQAPAPAQSAPDLQYQAPANEPYSGQIGPDGAISQPQESAPSDLVIPSEVGQEEQPAQAELPPTLPDSGEPPSPEELMLVSNHLTQVGDLPNAIQGFTMVLQQEPKNVNAYVGRGFAYYKMGNYDFAILDLTKAIELDDMNLSAFFHRGNALLMQGDLNEALADYEKAIELNRNVPDIFNAHGTALYNRGDLQDAIHDFDQAIRLDPNYVDAYFNRGSAYAKMNKHQLALDDFKKVLELAPDDATAMKRKKQMEKALRP